MSPIRLLVSHRVLRIQRSTAAGLDRGCPPDRRRSAIPWGVLGALGLIVAIECSVARNWLDFSDPVSLSWRFSAEASTTQAPGAEVLCVGDSLVKHGLFPAVIEQATGRRTVNLSTARGPALLTYFLFHRALDAGARPSAIIVNAKPAVLLGGPDYDARYWQEVLTLRESLELLQMTRQVPFMASVLAGRLLPSLRSRLEVRSNLLAALRGEVDPLHGINRVLWRNWTKNAGANVASVHSSHHGTVTPDDERQLHTNLFHVDPTNAEAIERLLKLAGQRKIPVFWLMAPLSPNLQALRDQSGAEARYEQFVRSIQARYPQVMTVLDARRAGYPPRLFVDATHLNGLGGLALSHSVATAIGPELSGRRSVTSAGWIALGSPSARPAGYEVSLEDLAESSRILQLDTIAHVSSR